MNATPPPSKAREDASTSPGLRRKVGGDGEQSELARHAHDHELVARAAAGDEEAFRAIVRRHERAVARTVTAMLGAGDDADDVGQETFVRLVGALPRFRGDAELRTYLTRIAINLCYDALARRRRRIGWLRFGAPEGDPQIPAATDDSLERDQRDAAVRRAVDALDAKHRAVVVLRVLEERSTREVAEILGVPEGTVMSRLKRGLEKVAARLGPEVRE
jgi:RNA polymerase sigma-70 factor, ECF subfamily